MTDQKKTRGRPRLHPQGLQSRLCIPLSRDEHDRLAKDALKRKMPLARLARERLSAG